MTDWHYADQILHINLTDRTARVLPTDLELKRSFVGGAGFVARLLTDAAAGPGDVALAGGPLSDGVAGRLALGARRGDGRIVCSSLGGRLAAALKETGYDALVLTGELEGPGYLVIDGDLITFADASHLRGLEIPETEQHLQQEGYTSLILGPAAEAGNPAAVLAHEGHYAGGSGVAAALGAKRLKAVLLPVPTQVPAMCQGCTRLCSGKGSAAHVDRANALGLDAPAAAGLPRPKRKSGPTLADLLGTCQRVFRDRPGELLRAALDHTQGLLTS